MLSPGKWSAFTWVHKVTLNLVIMNSTARYKKKIILKFGPRSKKYVHPSYKEKFVFDNIDY